MPSKPIAAKIAILIIWRFIARLEYSIAPSVWELALPAFLLNLVPALADAVIASFIPFHMASAKPINSAQLAATCNVVMVYYLVSVCAQRAEAVILPKLDCWQAVLPALLISVCSWAISVRL